MKVAHYEIRQKAAFDWPLAVAAVALDMSGSNSAVSARVVLGYVAPDAVAFAGSGASCLGGKTSPTKHSKGRAPTPRLQGAKPLSSEWLQSPTGTSGGKARHPEGRRRCRMMFANPIASIPTIQIYVRRCAGRANSFSPSTILRCSARMTDCSGASTRRTVSARTANWQSPATASSPTGFVTAQESATEESPRRKRQLGDSFFAENESRYLVGRSAATALWNIPPWLRAGGERPDQRPSMRPGSLGRLLGFALYLPPSRKPAPGRLSQQTMRDQTERHCGGQAAFGMSERRRCPFPIFR